MCYIRHVKIDIIKEYMHKWHSSKKHLENWRIEEHFWRICKSRQFLAIYWHLTLSLTSTNMVRIIQNFQRSYFVIIFTRYLKIMSYFFHLWCHTKHQIFLSIFKLHLPHKDEVKPNIRWNFLVYFCIHLKKIK